MGEEDRAAGSSDVLGVVSGDQAPVHDACVRREDCTHALAVRLDLRWRPQECVRKRICFADSHEKERVRETQEGAGSRKGVGERLQR